MRGSNVFTIFFEKGHEYTIERGSFVGHQRLEYDYIVIHILHPGTRPLIPDIPPGVGVPPPTSMDYVEQYLEKLITSIKSPNETYTYGEVSAMGPEEHLPPPVGPGRWRLARVEKFSAT